MKNYNQVESYIAANDAGKLAAFLETLKFDEILSVLEKLTDEKKAIVFESLDEYIAIKCFKVLPDKARQTLIKKMHYERAAKLLNSLPDDDLTALIEGLPSRVVNELLKLLNDENRRTLLSMLGYPENSVGRLMTPHYIAIKQNWLVSDVFTFIRHHGQNSETINVVYVLDDNGVLIDDIRMREFLFVDPPPR